MSTEAQRIHVKPVNRSMTTRGVNQQFGDKKRINPSLTVRHYDRMYELAEMYGATYGEVLEAMIDEYDGKPTFLTRKPSEAREEFPFFGLET